MLVLTRKCEEAVIITLPDGTRLRVLVLSWTRMAVKLGFDAGPHVQIFRDEIMDAIDRGEGRGTDDSVA